MKKYLHPYTITAAILTVTIITAALLYNRVFTQEVKSYGGSYSEGIIGTPRFINPVLAQSSADKDLTELTFGSLLDVSQDGDIEYRIAENLEVSTNQRQYVLSINPQARFSDGTPISAEDVVFTIEAIQNPFIKSPLFNQWSGVEVSETGLQEVTFNLAQPYADFIYNLGIGVLPKSQWENVSEDEFAFNVLNTNPIGSGAFYIDKIFFNEDGTPSEFVLEDNKHWHHKPYLSEIRIKIYKNADDLLRAYNKGSVDGAYGLNTENIKTSDKDLKTGDLPRSFGMFFNTENNESVLDAETRRALSYAVNRNQITQEVFGGFASETDNPFGYPSETAYDTDRAKELLEDHGWAQNSEGEYIKSIAGVNTPLTFSVAVPDIQEIQDVAKIVQSNLQDIGVWISIDTYQEQSLQNEVIRARSYDALLFGYILEKPSDIYAFWHSSQSNDPGLNVSMYERSTADSRLMNIRTEADREDDIDAFLSVWRDDMPALMLYTPQYLYLADEKFDISSYLSHQSDRFNRVHEWYLKTRQVWPFLIRS